MVQQEKNIVMDDTLETRADIREWARNLPKIDLHRHLEGSLRIDTLAEMAREHSIDLPSYDVEQLRPHVQMLDDPPDYQRFLGKFRLLRKFYTSREVVQRVTQEAILDAASDNIRYLELRFNPVALSREQDFPLSDVVAWVIEAVEQAQAQSGTRTCLIMQIGRDEPLSVAHEIVSLAIANFGPFVRGIDLAGDEVSYPPDRFAEPFREAREAGLGITVHAGEWAGADSISSAIHHLGAERIGHGIRAVENSEVIGLLYDSLIALEICPTSNLQTGAVRGMTQHPLVDLFNLRLRVTLNTDDPSISATTLSEEYVVAIHDLGLPQHLIYRMLKHSAQAAFIPPEERAQLLDDFRARLSAYPGAVYAFDNGM